MNAEPVKVSEIVQWPVYSYLHRLVGSPVYEYVMRPVCESVDHVVIGAVYTSIHEGE